MVAHTKSDEERFLGKTKRLKSGCLEWRGLKNDQGYGIIIMGNSKRRTRAHRVAYKLAHGEIPDGKWVLHKCDNPSCVEPSHLFLGNNQTNVQDMRRKGRGNGMLPEKAYAILWECVSGKRRKAVAEEYGVSLHVIKDIVGRRSYRSLSSIHGGYDGIPK